jgi:predicted MFS family arabinose efflux permease
MQATGAVAREPLTRHPVTFVLAMCSNLFFFSSMYLLVSPLPRYVDALGGGPFIVGLAIGAFSIAAVLSRPFSGRIVDRMGAKPMLIAGAANFGIASLLYLWTSSISLFIANRLFNGLGISFFTTAYMTFIVGLASVSRRGEAMGIAFISEGLALVISVTLGDSILHLLGFREIFMVASAAGFLSMTLAIFLRPTRNQDERPESENPPATSMKFIQVLKQRGVWTTALVMLVQASAYGSLLTFMPLYAGGRGLDNVGYFFSAYAVTFMLFTMPVGTISDRLGRKPVIVASMIGMATVFWLLAAVRGFSWFIGVGALYGITFAGARLSLDASMVDHADPGARGTAMSIQYGSVDMGVGIGGFVMGLVAGASGYPVMFAFVGVLALSSALFFSVIGRDVKGLTAGRDQSAPTVA